MTSSIRLPNSSPSVDAAVQVLAHAFLQNGYELYLVGGAVRDALLGVLLTELDFATSARPQDIVTILTPVCDAGPFRVGERFGTIGAIIQDVRIEITTYRSAETYEPDSRKPDVEFGSTIYDDLGRRDLTINAIALDCTDGELIDPYGGVRDLRAGIVRCVGDPERRFREDPLRLLRAVRFASRLEFRIEDGTWQALVHCADRLITISRERIRDEYQKVLLGENAVRGLELLRDGGLIRHSVPQLMFLTEMPDHGPNHPLSLWDHTMRVVSGVPPRLVARWAALLHDIAKPSTRQTEPNGRVRFFHHDEVGAEMARDILSGLRYPIDVVRAVSLVVEVHMQLHAYSPDWSDGAVRRLMMRLGPFLSDALAVVRADAAGHASQTQYVRSSKFDALEERVEALSKEQPSALKSPLSGRDLMDRYSLPPGPWVGNVKQKLLDRVIDGELAPNDREGAWRMADDLVASQNLVAP